MELAEIPPLMTELQALGDDISFFDFYDYLRSNQPVLVRRLCASWPCMDTMVTPSGELNVPYLTQAYGKASVPVVSAGSSGYGDATQTTMAFEEYLNALNNHPGLLQYAKDFHFARAYPSQRDYSVPAIAADDWLNWWYDASGHSDDYRFLYCGPAGSSTPLHHDVLYSASWSVNVSGYKLWILIPPAESANSLYDHFGNLIVNSVLTADEVAQLEQQLGSRLGPTPIDAKSVDGNLSHLRRQICLQGPGDFIFVPSGWHHEVYNVGAGPVLSINHNWFGGAALPLVWSFLQRELSAVRTAISNLRADMGDADWHAQCQVLLKANCGFDLHMFANLVANKALGLMQQIEATESRVSGISPGAGNQLSDDQWKKPGSAALMIDVAAAPTFQPPRQVILDSLAAARRVLSELTREQPVCYHAVTANFCAQSAAGAVGSELLGENDGVMPTTSDAHGGPVIDIKELLQRIHSALSRHSE